MSFNMQHVHQQFNMHQHLYITLVIELLQNIVGSCIFEIVRKHHILDRNNQHIYTEDGFWLSDPYIVNNIIILYKDLKTIFSLS